MDGAISSYQKAVEIQPEQPFWVYLNLANLLVQNEEFEKAILAYREASRLDPDNPGVYRLLGEVQVKYGDVAGAIESYRHAIAIDSKQPVSLYENLADALLANHQQNEAIEAYHYAIEIQPNLPNVREKLAAILDGQYLVQEEVDIVETDVQSRSPMETDLQHTQFYHQATEILNQAPDLPKSTSVASLSVADLEVSPDRITKKLEFLKEKLNRDYKERLADGLLNELAALQLSVESMEFQLKVLTSSLLMPDSITSWLFCGDYSIRNSY